ncbi:MAG: hypothetical protein K0S33_3270, partial [Bacteroidetes bacterium]|nr:hypothetical protein [Bacteroidota bacterium]
MVMDSFAGTGYTSTFKTLLFVWMPIVEVGDLILERDVLIAPIAWFDPFNRAVDIHEK